MSKETAADNSNATSPADLLRIDFLYLDLAACGRCRGTERNLESALDVVRDVVEATGIGVELNKIHVESASHARDLRLVTSPTIRVNGRDIALELRESPCEECDCDAATDNPGDRVACRVWVHRGREYVEAPVEMIIEAILREAYGAAVRSQPPANNALPENIERFFARTGAADVSCCGAETDGRCARSTAADGC